MPGLREQGFEMGCKTNYFNKNLSVKKPIDTDELRKVLDLFGII